MMIPGVDVDISVGELDRLTSLPSVSRTLASPKSRTFTVPLSAIVMFAGFKSR